MGLEDQTKIRDLCATSELLPYTHLNFRQQVPISRGLPTLPFQPAAMTLFVLIPLAFQPRTPRFPSSLEPFPLTFLLLSRW